MTKQSHSSTGRGTQLVSSAVFGSIFFFAFPSSVWCHRLFGLFRTLSTSDPFSLASGLTSRRDVCALGIFGDGFPSFLTTLPVLSGAHPAQLRFKGISLLVTSLLAKKPQGANEGPRWVFPLLSVTFCFYHLSRLRCPSPSSLRVFCNRTCPALTSRCLCRWDFSNSPSLVFVPPLPEQFSLSSRVEPFRYQGSLSLLASSVCLLRFSHFAIRVVDSLVDWIHWA